MDSSDDSADAQVTRFKADFDRMAADSKASYIERLKRLREQKRARIAAKNTHRTPALFSSDRPSRISTASVSETDDPLQRWGTRKHRVKEEEDDDDKNIKEEPAQDTPFDNSVQPINQDEEPGRSARDASPPLSRSNGTTPHAEVATNQRPEPSLFMRPESTSSPMPMATTPSQQSGDANSHAVASGSKRPAGSAITGDRGKALKAPRRRLSQDASSSAGPSNAKAGHISSGQTAPDWYLKMPKPNTRQVGQSNADVSLSRLKSLLQKVRDQKIQGAEYMDIRDRLHTMTFLEVDGKLLRAHRMLHDGDGLPLLFKSSIVPWDIKADAEELYNKWCTGEFETDLYRGIVFGKGKKSKGKTDGSSGDRLAEDSKRFRLMEPKQPGNGRLLNGAWWPSQLATLRDGAHGSSQGGITGSAAEGAYSVIMAGGMDPSSKPYPNEDRGDEVLYCGTDNQGTEIQPSVETQYMLTNERLKKPVRLIRSHNLNSPHAPELGFRYDGLYLVVSHEKMDPPEVKRCRHRFRLLRCADQDPIRSEGPEKRPTAQEVEAYEKDRKNRGR